MNLAIVEPELLNAESPQTNGEPFIEQTLNVRQPSAKQLAARFTVDNAKEMSDKAIQAKKDRAEALRKAYDTATVDEHEYRKARLARTRTQLDKLDALLEQATDWKAIKAISDAISRLYVIEANLAGRPGAGNLRPGRQSTQHKPAAAEPL